MCNFFFLILHKQIFRKWKDNTHHTNQPQLPFKPRDRQMYRTRKSTQINKTICMNTNNYHSIKIKIAVIVLSCVSVVIIFAFAYLSHRKYLLKHEKCFKIISLFM